MINKQKIKKNDKTVLSAKHKLSTIGFFIFKDLIDSYSSHDKFISVNSNTLHSDSKYA